jgi:hypothetical protein
MRSPEAIAGSPLPPIIEKRHAACSSGAPFGRVRRLRRPCLATTQAVLFAFLWLAASCVAGAEPLRQQKPEVDETPRAAPPRPAAFIPTPPRRPPDLSPREPPRAASPERSEPSRPPLPPPVALPPVDPSIPPPTLPRASREAMRRCALEWERMKREGHAGPPMWREFATKCLTR